MVLLDKNCGGDNMEMSKVEFERKSDQLARLGKFFNQLPDDARESCVIFAQNLAVGLRRMEFIRHQRETKSISEIQASQISVYEN